MSTTLSCYVCGADDVRLELHHIVPDWSLTIPLCVPCHRVQTSGQWANRTLPLRDDPAQRLWAVLHGVLALLIARTRSPDDVDALRLAHRLALRMLCEVGEIDIGPNPTRTRAIIT